MSDKENPFQIAVCETAGWASPLIEKATGGRYTHSYAILSNSTYSMEPDGLIERPLDYWGSNNPTTQYVTVPEFEKRFMAYITRHAGIYKYDYLGDVIVGIDDLTPKWMDPFWKRVEQVENALLPNHWFCSAFTDDLLHYAGIDMFTDGRPYKSVTPEDQARVILSKWPVLK